MSSITTRAAKGSALTHAEVDANFTNLNSGKAEVSGQTFTGAVVLPAGSATAGGVQVGTGATYKPGIYSPGADQLAISTGGTGRLFVDSTGRVGVGGNPSYQLHATGTGSVIIASQGTTDSSFLTNVSGTQSLYIHSTTGLSEINELRNLPITFATNATERLRITAAGLVGIGTSSPVGKLSITTSSATAPGTLASSTWDSTYSLIAGATGNNIGGCVGLGFVAGGVSAGYGTQIVSLAPASDWLPINYHANIHVWYGGGSEKARIDSSGRLLVGLTSANTSGAKLQTSDGLTFPSSQISSADPNTLDDYEEGTWTPSVGGTATYATQSGRYTKIGRIVHAYFYVTITTLGTGSTWQMSGLPFTSNNSVQGGGSVSYWGNLSGSFVYITPYTFNNTSVSLYAITAAGATLAGSASIFGNNATVQGFVVYEV